MNLEPVVVADALRSSLNSIPLDDQGKMGVRFSPAMRKNSVVHVDPDIMSGTPVFVGTRVPFRTLIDYLEGGHSLDGFLDAFPTVRREQAVAALEEAGAAGLEHARTA